MKQSNPRKRKADSLGRLSNSNNSNNSNNAAGVTTKAGRGALVGWTRCPLCGRHSQKKFALGRGIAAHLHSVHTPWKPGKAERRKRRREEEERQRRRKRQQKSNNDNNNQQQEPHETPAGPQEGWEPTEEEVQQWEERVLKIAHGLEEAHQNQPEHQQQQCQHEQSTKTTTLLDRSGKEIQSYRNSLPPFIAAAAEGSLTKLREMILEAKGKPHAETTTPTTLKQSPSHVAEEVVESKVQKLLDSRDRHLSTAEHWAAGEGHLDCLQYLLELRHATKNADTTTASTTSTIAKRTKKIRRRDGKTCLHYAARNGRNDCVAYLIDQCGFGVEEPSGDGTTPFHLACFGLHLDTIQLLRDKGANPQQTNEWGCHAAHWVGMAKTTTTTTTTKQQQLGTRAKSSGKTNPNGDHGKIDARIQGICTFLQEDCGVDFCQHQKHGHSALHKAAQSQNYSVIRWMSESKENGGAGLSKQEKEQAGAGDSGGHKPSGILGSVGGDAAFVNWMKGSHGW
mmetsp:Transcript_1675/g.3559  ORF Transcript_1675/g.3559 Transcript_1675/m.3559 type:complete len:509 (+) Transcript_1675:154-1680(+)